MASEDDDRAGDEEDVLEYASKGEDKPAPNTNQEYSSDVQQERNHGIGQQHERAELAEAVKGLQSLSEWQNEQIDCRADLFIMIKHCIRQ